MGENNQFERFMDGMNLTGIFLDNMKFEVRRECSPVKEQRISVDVGAEIEVLGVGDDDEPDALGQHTVVASIQYAVRVHTKGIRRAYVMVDAGFDVLMTCEAGSYAEAIDEELGAIVERNTWPYLRELLDSTSRRAGVRMPVAPFQKWEG